jgi:hypothetical protein
MTATIVLVDDARRDIACRAVREAPEGYVVRIKPAGKTRDQEDKYHAQIRDIARQVPPFMGHISHPNDWKRLLVDAFAKAMREAGTPLHHDGRVVPSLDFERVVQLGIQTSEFYKAEASNFVEFLYAWGADQNVQWREAGARSRELV